MRRRLVQIGLTVIVLLSSVACAQPTPITVIVTATPTDTPQATPTTVVVTATPTHTPEPTATRQPTRTPTPSPTADPNLATVTSITDGDTITVMLEGQEYKLRYIGMDCPELDQEYGQDARVANQLLVGGQQVRLERDVSDTDSFGRLLRYVYLMDDTFVNGELVEA